jgi:hypothetical protein
MFLEGDLDEIVREVKDDEASSINAGGKNEQIEFLGLTTVAHALTKIHSAPRCPGWGD